MAVEEGLAVAERAGSLAHLAGKHLTFRLAAEEYGLAILQVREIIGLMDITMIPRTPHFVRGVINLRGKVIPVIDLRAKFGMPMATENSTVRPANSTVQMKIETKGPRKSASSSMRL